MSNFKITKTILENINEQNDRINECVDTVNGYRTDEETRVNQEIQRQQNEEIRQEHYNNIENRFNEINTQMVNITKQIYPTMTREEIQNILNEGGDIKFTSGTYLLDYTINSELTNVDSGLYDVGLYLDIKSNSNIYIDKGVTFNIKVCELDWYRIFRVYKCENVTINGGIIIGDRINHTQQVSEGQWGHGVHIVGSKNIEIKNMKIKNCYGDGIFINKSNNVLISNCISDNNRRQGLSICNGEHIIVDNCNFLNTNGQTPQAGIDIEPNFSTDIIKNIIIKNCTIEDNQGSGIEVNLTKLNTESETVVESVFISIDNCVIKNNKDGVGYFYMPEGKDLINSVKGFIKITNSNILSSNRAAILIMNIKDNVMPVLMGDNLNISNWVQFGIGFQVYSITDNASNDNIVEYGGCYFNNITFSDLPNTSDYDCPIYIQNYEGRKFNAIFNNIYIVDDVPKNRWCKWKEGEGYIKYINKDIDFILTNNSVPMDRLSGLRCIVNGSFKYQLLSPKLLKGKEYHFVNGGNNNSFALLLSTNTFFDSQFVKDLELYITDKGSELCIKSDGSNTWRTEKVYGNVSPSGFNFKRKVFYGGNAPTKGTWEKGDIIMNANPSSASSGVEYWVCVESGNPGVWETKLKK